MPNPKEINGFAQRVAAMDEEDRLHFRDLIDRLSYCYGEESGQAVVLFISEATPYAEVSTLNCDDMEAQSMLKSAHDYLLFINTKDAPPKEKFN